MAGQEAVLPVDEGLGSLEADLRGAPAGGLQLWVNQTGAGVGFVEGHESFSFSLLCAVVSWWSFLARADELDPPAYLQVGNARGDGVSLPRTAAFAEMSPQ